MLFRTFPRHSGKALGVETATINPTFPGGLPDASGPPWTYPEIPCQRGFESSETGARKPAGMGWNLPAGAPVIFSIFRTPDKIASDKSRTE
jgi:hypothetical protein